MMNKQNLLIYGYDLQLIKSKIRILKTQYHIYCVSHNADLYIDEELGALENVVMLQYDLNRVPFFEEARRVISAVNDSFKNVKTRKAHYLYELNHLCEGGMGQRYSDYLYAVAFFKKIVQDYKITAVYSEKIDDSREIDALTDVAKSGHLRMRFISGKNHSISEMKKGLYFTLCKIPGISLLVTLETQLQYIYGIRKLAEKCNKDSELEKYDIGFVMNFNANKHINWLLEQLEEIEGKLSYCVFCFRANAAREKLSDLGKCAKSVEGYFDFKMALKDWREYLKDSFAIRKQVRKMPPLDFQTVDITETVRNYYIMYHLFREKLIDILYERIVFEFLKKNQVKMMTGGSSNYISAKLFYFNTLKLNRKMEYFQDYTKYSYYDYRKTPMEESEPYGYIMNLRFALFGSERIEILKENGWKGEVYYFPDSRKKLYNKYNPGQSKPVRQDGVMKILWAPSYPLAGLYSIYDFVMDNEAVLQGLCKYDCEIYVKYHPGQQEGLSNYFREKYKKNGKIKFVNQHEGIEQYLEQADIIFSSVSMVLIDAALKGRLVICLAGDLDLKMLRDDVRDNIYLLKREDIDFNKILSDEDFRRDQIARQDTLLEKWFDDPGHLSKVKILQKHIKNLD